MSLSAYHVKKKHLWTSSTDKSNIHSLKVLYIIIQLLCKYRKEMYNAARTVFLTAAWRYSCAVITLHVSHSTTISLWFIPVFGESVVTTAVFLELWIFRFPFTKSVRERSSWNCLVGPERFTFSFWPMMPFSIGVRTRWWQFCSLTFRKLGSVFLICKLGDGNRKSWKRQ